MWVFLNNAMVSVVSDRTNPANVLVRGRLKGDVERALGIKAAAVKETPHADYRFRTSVKREFLATRLAALARSIDYPNFKGSVPHNRAHAARSDAYMRVWGVMMAAQRAQAPNSGGIFDAGGCHADDVPWDDAP